MSRQFVLVSLLTSILLAGCNLGITPEVLPSAAATETLPPSATLTPIPSATLTASLPAPSFTPTIMPTIQPVTGIVLAATNIRSLPSKGAGERIGGLYPNERVYVIGRNDNATWLWIVYDQSPTGTGWVTSRAVELQSDMGYLPIALFPEGAVEPQMLPAFVYTLEGTPLPLNPPPPGAMTATVLYLTNVRLGPNIGFLTIGSLPPGSVVTLTGRIQSSDWLQIDYPSGPGGRAWVSADGLLLTEKPKALPVFNSLGTPAVETTDATAVPVAAPGDTSQSPSAPLDTPLPPTATPAGTIGEVSILLNVRTGPAQSTQSIGTLNPQEQVLLLGKTTNGLWYLIQYPAAPNGRAWVAADFIVVIHGDASSLPLYDNQGNLVGG